MSCRPQTLSWLTARFLPRVPLNLGPVRVIRGVDPRLDLKAIEAVRQWLFVPGKFRGTPVDVIADIQVDFTLL